MNYIKFKTVTYTDACPLPTIQDILDSLADSFVVFTIDLRSGYWQCPMEENSRDKTAFTCPFGLQNAPAVFKRLTEITLGELRGKICFLYLDSITIYFPSWTQHFRDCQHEEVDPDKIWFNPTSLSWQNPCYLGMHGGAKSAFEALKTCLVSPPILRHPNFDIAFVIYTKASDMGLGAVLVQKSGLGNK